MHDVLNGALREAMDEEFLWADSFDGRGYDYDFTEEFEQRLRLLSQMADRTYVSVGRHRLRRAAAMALIAAMLLASGAGVLAIRRPVITWLTEQNHQQGTLDVTFDVDDPDGLTDQFRCIKPQVPETYRITREETYPNVYYQVDYENEAGQVIYYSQTGGLDSMGLSLDNEDADFYEVEVNGHKGYAWSKAGNHALTWSDGIYLFDLSGTCDMDVLEEIAKSIQ